MFLPVLLGWICHICKQPAERELYGLNLPLSPEADHDLALVNGGNNTSGNIRCAHRVCNQWKLTNVDSPQHKLMPELYEIVKQEMSRFVLMRGIQDDTVFESLYSSPLKGSEV
jgi:hypothetical protein